MKKLLFFALMFCATTFADTWKVAVTTNSVVIAPRANKSQVYTEWATNAVYAAGDYCQNGSVTYWTPNGGTSGANTTTTTNGWNIAHTVPVTVTAYDDEPDHSVGLVTGDDGIIWKRVSSSGRAYIILYADATNDVLYDLNSTATTNSGGRLGALFPKQTLPVPDEVTARVESSGTATIRVVEL